MIDKELELGKAWGILKSCHIYFNQACRSGYRRHTESSGRALASALETYMDTVVAILQKPAPAPPPSTATEEIKLAFKRLGAIKSGEFVREEDK
jgi:hypothetical protein